MEQEPKHRAKIIKFPEKQKPFLKFLDELRNSYNEGRVIDFICVTREKYKEGEEVEGFSSQIAKYWFGEETCIGMIGLCEVMKDEILTYMAGRNDEFYPDNEEEE